MTILLSDSRVAAVPVHENGDPLVALDRGFGPSRALVRTGLAERLVAARDLLPLGIGLRVVEGHRSVADQQAIIARYAGQVCAARPGIGATELHHLTSRYVAPVAVAPHVAGAAVDLTLVDATGEDLDLGTPIDATPEEHRDLLAAVLGGVGLVNYPTEWWHWSYGDRYWALLTGADAALYGPARVARSAA